MLPDRISASILSADFACLGDQIQQAEAAGIDWLHIDVIDGVFAPNITMGQFIVETCRRISKLPLDVHLMIEHPEQHIETFAESGSSNLSIHIENNPHIHRTLDQIRKLGCKPGVVINPGTPALSLEAVLPHVDFVLVMSVNPGYSGQQFISQTVNKIKKIRTMLDQNGLDHTEIEVDGGITPVTLPLVKTNGANIYVAATAIFKHPQGIQAGVSALKAAWKD
jgi:ribulose-phosphate 3-epimerase